ncbi:MAG: UDP-N-acetylglucosamine 2-epimerase [Bacteroidota bacterium]
MQNEILKIAVILGTRAQMIKMAPVLQTLDKYGLKYWFLHTGQHDDTFDDLRKEFNIRKPDTVASGANETNTLGKLLKWIGSATTETLLTKRRLLPVRKGVVLVHGDTLSTIWGSILGRFTRNKVVHIEAGLRSKRLLHPFPEEIVRRLTGLLATHHACPGKEAVNNLGGYSEYIRNTQGNTLVDSVSYALQSGYHSEQMPNTQYAIASIHRAETLYNNNRLHRAIQIIESLAEDRLILVVGHPSLLARLKNSGLISRLEGHHRIEIIPRMPYTPFINLLANANLLATDGGSNQEESSYLGIPTLILREATERPEGLGSNATLIGLSVEKAKYYSKHYSILQKTPKRQKIRPSEIIADWTNELIEK